MSPIGYRSSRARLEQRQHGGKLFRLMHVLEALFSLILLPLPALIGAVVALCTGVWIFMQLCLRVFYSDNNNIPFIAKPFTCLYALYPILFWTLLFASYSLLIAVFSPFFLFLSGFYAGYHYGLAECARRAWKDGWCRSEKYHSGMWDYVDRLQEEGPSIHFFLLPQGVVPYTCLIIFLLIAGTKWWMAQPTTINPLQPLL